MKIFQQSFKFLAIASVLFFSTASFAENSPEDGGQIDTKEEVEAYIQHHIQDAHDFNLFSYTNDEGERKHFGFPLPVILWSSNGLTTFM
jgi:F-type H+-transporting ATPase subunit a